MIKSKSILIRAFAAAAIICGLLGSTDALAGQSLASASVSHKQHPALGKVMAVSPSLHPKWQRVRNDILERSEVPVAGLERLIALEPAAGQTASRASQGGSDAWGLESLEAYAEEELYGPPSKRDIAERIRRRLAELEYRADDADYWQTPGETMARNQGDCEDHAIMALHLALLSGIAHEEAGIAVGYDKLGRAHAVMVLDAGSEILAIDLNEPAVRSLEENRFSTKFVAYLDRLLILR